MSTYLVWNHSLTILKDSQAALTKFHSLDRYTISSKSVMLSFVHTGVFVPVSERDPVSTRLTFSPLNNPSMRLTYWDEEAYLSELVLTTEDIPFIQNSKEGSYSTTGKPASTNATGEDGVVKETKSNDKTKKRKAETGPTTTNKMVSTDATASRSDLNFLNRMFPLT